MTATKTAVDSTAKKTTKRKTARKRTVPKKTLVIVESLSKAKTIGKLGKQVRLWHLSITSGSSQEQDRCR